MPGRSAAAEQARGSKRQPSVMSAGSLAVEAASMSHGDKAKESKRKAKLAALAKQKREADGVILVSSGDDADADDEDDDDIVILPSQSQRIRRGGETGKGKERAAPGSVQDKAEQEGVLDQGQVSNAVNSPLQPSQRANLAPSQSRTQTKAQTQSSTESAELGVRPRVSVIPATQSSHSRSQENRVLPNEAEDTVEKGGSNGASGKSQTPYKVTCADSPQQQRQHVRRTYSPGHRIGHRGGPVRPPPRSRPGRLLLRWSNPSLPLCSPART